VSLSSGGAGYDDFTSNLPVLVYAHNFEQQYFPPIV